MEFKVKKDNIKSIMNLFNKVTTNFDFNNVSDNILFKIKNNRLILRATNDLTSAKAIFDDISEKSLIDVRFLVSAKELINFIKFSDSEFINFNLKAKEAEEGKGILIIKGKSKAKLPLKNLLQFPKFPEISEDFNNIMNRDNFINKLDILSKFTDQNASNYLSGINYNQETMIANRKISSIIFKHDIDMEDKFIISTDIVDTIKKLNTISISKDKFFNVRGVMNDVGVVLSYRLINDEYPVERINKAKERWLNSEYSNLNISYDNISTIHKKLNHMINNDKDELNINVSEDSIKFFYEHNNFSFERRVEEDNDINVKLKIHYKRIEEIVNLINTFPSDIINIRLLKEDDLMIIKGEKYLYIGGAIDII